MRTITIRQLQRELYTQINDLPVVVTRRANTKKGHPVNTVFVIMPYRDDLLISKEASDLELVKKPKKRGLLGFLK